MKTPRWPNRLNSETEVKLNYFQKWLAMDCQQWVRWICSILTFAVCMVTIIIPIVFVAMICVEGWDDSPFDGFVCRIFTPYDY